MFEGIKNMMAMAGQAKQLREKIAQLQEELGRKTVEGDTFSASLTETTDFKAVYRLRVIRQPESGAKGYGPVEVMVLSSPIYADDIGGDLLMTGPVDLNKTWVEIPSEFKEDDPRVK